MDASISGYRTIQSENFELVDEDELVGGDDRAHRKFIALIVLAIVCAATFATLFAVVS